MEQIVWRWCRARPQASEATAECSWSHERTLAEISGSTSHLKLVSVLVRWAVNCKVPWPQAALVTTTARNGRSFVFIILRRGRAGQELSWTLSRSSDEPGLGHAAAGFLVFHECLPDESAARVLGHEQGNAQVDADDVGIEPVRSRVEGVDKTVTFPGLAAEAFPHGPQGAKAFLRQEGDRAAGRAGHDRAVQQALLRGTAPGEVTLGRV